MAVQKLTEVVLKSLPLPSIGQEFVFDATLKGFGVRLSRETKSFFAERRVNGKTTRITIGPHPILSVEKARREAQVILGELALGVDRRAKEKAERIKAVTLSEVWAGFKEARKTLRPRTIKSYEGALNRSFADWLNKPWLSIAPAMVAKRHTEIGKRNGPAAANVAMQTLSSLINYAMEVYTDANGVQLIAKSPTDILSATDAWYRMKPKTNIVRPTQIRQWWVAVEALTNDTMSDYLKLLLLTGLRRREAAELLWADVDFESKTLTARETKNHTDHTIPVSSYVLDLLLRRKQAANGSPYVFSGNGTSGHLQNTDAATERVTKGSGVQFTLHDLRRTFVTIAESLDLSSYTVKKLVNHAMGADVTAAHYVVFDLERLRVAMEKINLFMLRHAGVLAPDVIQLPNAQSALAAA